MGTRLIERNEARGRAGRLARRLRRAGERVADALTAGLASLAAPPEPPRYAYLPVLATSRRRHPRRRS